MTSVLVIAKRYSPAHQAQYRRPPVPTQELPDLRSSSDIAWLAWKPYHDKGVKLKHIITWSVTNGGTQRLVAAALEDMSSQPLKDADKALKPYPWVSWLADEHPGPLVLGRSGRPKYSGNFADRTAGSPNGVGVGYMLSKVTSLLRGFCMANN